MNHYSSSSLRHYLNRFEEAFTTSGAPWPDTFFNDSFEVYGSDWTPGLPEAFGEDHGYRLESMIPEFLGEGDPDISARVVTDYRETLASLLEENFTLPWTEWAHGHDVKIRNQAHGSPANIIDLYADVDIPECESFGRSDFDIPGLRQDPIIKPNDGDPAVLKFASSAAHLTGKKLVSAEALTWLTEHFRTSLSQCKPEVDLMFASGVNHLYFHGAPYSPEGADFPGWKFYAAIDMSPTNNIWHHAPAFFDYVSRCQSFLSSGKPDNDVLLYHKHINDGKAEPYFKTRISFENTSDSIPCLTVKRQAHGNSYTQAVKNAQKTIYRHQWNNDTLHLDTYFQLDTALWRGNQIQVQIAVPEAYRLNLIHAPNKEIRRTAIFQEREKFRNNREQTQHYLMRQGKLEEIN